MHRKYNSLGFTLIELLVVIAIIGILATFLVANFNSAQQRARDAQRKSDLNQLQKSLELYKSDSSGSTYYARALSLLATNYIRSVPTDPSTGANYGYAPAPSGCETLGNANYDKCTTYLITATLEITTDPSSTKSQTRCGLTPTTGAFTVCNP